MSDIITITETARLVVEQDTDAQCPRGDDHMLTGFVEIPGRGDSRRNSVPEVHEETFGLANAYFRFDDYAVYVPDANDGRGGFRYPFLQREEEITARWAKIFHGQHIEYDSEHGGFWFVQLDGADMFTENWPDLVLGTPEHLAKQAEIIEQEREVYRQWADGEVYGVLLQRRATFARVERNELNETWDLVNPLTEDDITRNWLDEDSLWGCYLDDEYTAQQVALDNFGLTDDEYNTLKGA